MFRAGVGLHPSFCTTEDPDSPHLAVPSSTGSLYIGFFGVFGPAYHDAAATRSYERAKIMFDRELRG